MNVIVEREKGLLEVERRIAELRSASPQQAVDLSAEIGALEEKYAQIQREIFSSLTPWQRVNMARHPNRPTSAEYIEALDSFDELHGDRHFRDDPAVIGGFAKINHRKIIVVGQQRGRDTKENLRRNFGMVSPEGYRKAQRMMELGARFALPIVTFIDTKGADPGIGSEERAQSEAIASCLYTLSDIGVPVVAAVIGEGGSGGALAIGIADHILMLEHSVYSVASPEGCAAILWGDAGKAEEAASRLRLTSDDLKHFGIVDEVIPEPLGGAHRDAQHAIRSVLGSVSSALDRLSAMSPSDLVAARYRKYRQIGTFAVQQLHSLNGA